MKNSINRVDDMIEGRLLFGMKNNSMKIIKTLASFQACIILFLSPLIASAIVVDNFTVDSYLGQPLESSILVDGKQGDDLSLLTVSMASYEEFQQAGINYYGSLDKLDFKVENVNPLRSIVRVTSVEPIEEPFVHVLLKLTWDGGQLLREFTALIDPPVYTESKAAPVDTVISESNELTVAASELAVLEEITPTSEYVNSPNSVDTSSISTVSARDSLSTTALTIQDEYPDLSIYQIMVALYRDNPDAFIDNNINGLVKGSILNVDEISNIRELSKKEGVKFFFDQMDLWKVSALNPQNIDEIKIAQSDALESIGEDINTSLGEDTSAVLEEQNFSASANASTTPEFQVGSTSLNESEESQVLANELGELKSKIIDLEASYESAKLQNKELKETIEILENQLVDSNKLIELSNQELASLQQVQSEEEAANILEQVVSQNELTESTTPIDTNSSESALANKLETDPEQLNAIIEEEAALIESNEPTQSPKVVEESVDINKGDVELLAAVSEVEEVKAPEIEEVKTPEVVKAKAQEVVKTKTPSLIERVKAFIADFWKIILGGVGALLLLTLLLGRSKSKSVEIDDEFEMSFAEYTPEDNQSENSERKVVTDPTEWAANESESADLSSINMEALRDATQTITDFDENEVAEDEVTRESSFLTVYNDGDVVVNADEIDPIAEADVYIAYGRKDQGEEVLLEGVKAFPERSDIKVKLLELYADSSDSEKFSAIYHQLEAGGVEKDIDVWSKVQELKSKVQLLDEGDVPASAIHEEVVPAPSEERSSVTFSDSEFDIAVNSVADELTESHFNEITLEMSEGNHDIDEGLKSIQIEDLNIDDLNVAPEIDFPDEIMEGINHVSITLSETQSKTDEVDLTKELSEIDFSDELEMSNVSDAMELDISSLDISSVMDFPTAKDVVEEDQPELSIELEGGEPEASIDLEANELGVSFDLDDNESELNLDLEGSEPEVSIDLEGVGSEVSIDLEGKESGISLDLEGGEPEISIDLEGNEPEVSVNLEVNEPTESIDLSDNEQGLSIELDDELSMDLSLDELTVDFSHDELVGDESSVVEGSKDVVENDLNSIDLNLGEDIVDLPDGVNDPQTQLDLAKVFIELEDIDGARKILNSLSNDAAVGEKAKELLAELK